MNFIHKTKAPKRSHPNDCNAIARKRSESRVGNDGNSDYEDGYGEINWNSKRRK